ncbi:MAG: hypothetical protein ABI876_05815 [Bacteroidota bacterium]
MELKEIWPYMAAVAAILGASFNGFGYLSKTIRERRRLSREALFGLLGVWKALSLVSTKRESEIVIEVMQKRFPEAAIPDNMKSFALQWIQSLLAGIQGDVRQSWTDGLKEKFQTAIAKLAAIRPILAFEINGNLTLLNLIKYIDNHEQRVIQTIPSFGFNPYIPQLNTVMEFAREKAYEDARKSLIIDILKVARGCGILGYVKTRIKMHRLERNRDDATRKFINGWFDTIPPDFLKSPSVIQPAGPLIDEEKISDPLNDYPREDPCNPKSA